MNKAAHILAMAGFPDTPEGRANFYKQYPDENSFKQKMKLGGGVEAFPQQPTEKKFFEKGFIPQGPVGFYKQGGVSTNELAFPQQPTADQFYSRGFIPQGPVGFYAFGGAQPFPQAPPMEVMFSGAQWSPQYSHGGGLPGGSNEMPCLECGGNMPFGGPVTDVQNYMMEVGGYQSGIQMMDNMEEFKSGGNWIQKATASIKRRGTEGVCTGAKFGSSSCPPGSKRYNLAKTFRAMAKKEFGGDANNAGINDFDQDAYPAMIANAFANKLESNTQNNIADGAAEQVAAQQDAIAQMTMAYGGMPMAQAGRSMNQYGYNPHMNNMDLFQQKSDFMDQQQQQAGQRFMNATQQLAGTANPYMDWSQSQIEPMPQAQDGYNTGVTGNTRYRLNPRTGQVESYHPGFSKDYPRTSVDPRSTNYPPNYQGQYYTDQWNTNQQGTQGARGIPYNYNPYMQWKQSGQNLAPMGQSYLQSYEATKRLFGPGARKVKMTFRTYYDPQTGQTHQVPDQGQGQQHPMQQPGWSPTTGYKKPGHVNTYAEDVAALQQQAGDMPSSGVMPRKDFTQKHGRNWFGNDSPEGQKIYANADDEIRAIKRQQRKQQGQQEEDQQDTPSRMRGFGRVARADRMSDADAAQDDAQSADHWKDRYNASEVTGQTYRNQTRPTATDQESPERMAERIAWEKKNPTNRAYGGIPMAQFGYNAYGQPDARFQGPLSAQFVDASTQGQAGQTGQSYYDTTVTGKRKMGLDGESSADWVPAVISGARALANSGENAKTKEEMQRKSLADYQFYSVDRPDQGKWNPTGMSAGMFDPNNMGVIQQPGQNYAMEGPRFQEGGEYDLTPEEIDNIMRNGGTVTYLD